MKLGTAIRARRKELGLSLAALAARTDTDKGHLSKIEAGHLEPPLPRLRRIAQELGCTVPELLTV